MLNIERLYEKFCRNELKLVLKQVKTSVYFVTKSSHCHLYCLMVIATCPQGKVTPFIVLKLALDKAVLQ